jgi:hypothetical protein
MLPVGAVCVQAYGVKMEIEDIGYKTPTLELSYEQAQLLRDMLSNELGYSRRGALFSDKYVPELSENGKALERILEVLHRLLDDWELDGVVEVPLAIKLPGPSASVKREAA